MGGEERRASDVGRRAWVAVVAVMLGAAPAIADAPAPGVGTDLARDAQCVTCHADVGAAWATMSSHSLLHDCVTCHAVKAASGKGHADRPACAKCHSEATHPAGADCGTCHDPHGSPNAFLVKSSITLPSGGSAAVTVTKPEGASIAGVARAGVTGAQAGTGLCEVCHASTKFYDAAGKGATHSTKWCAECHVHAAGFAPK